MFGFWNTRVENQQFFSKCEHYFKLLKRIIFKKILLTQIKDVL